ncbi:MAG: ABC transporter permease [Anaeromyxobacter sp.]|nr:ABC transporter permease [Anaeromyxobacter sp.]MBL0277272.1 ABC transporter permease [Anaeromyxobacter sp.]
MSGGAGPQGRPGADDLHADHPVAPVFSTRAFLLVLVGVVVAGAGAPVLHAALAARGGLPAGLATGLAAGGAGLVGAAFGAAAALVGRRLAFYEVTAAGLLWTATVALRVAVLPLSRGGPAGLEGLEAQGTLVVVLGLLSAGVLAAVAVFIGATLAYLLAGSGRLDASLSFELYVARSHLRLSPRTLLGLFLLCVTGVLPGLLILLVRSLVADAAERRAERRGLLHARARLPATLLMTLISIGGVAIGVWALTVVLSVMSGFEADLKHKILGHNAHGMVMKYGQNDFTDWREAREKVRGVPGVVGATPFLYNEVMIAAGQNLTGAVVKGIDPATIGTVTDLPAAVEEGELAWLSEPTRVPISPVRDAAAPPPAGPLPAIVIGRELARSLRVFVGDQVSVVSPFGDLGPAGPQPKSRLFRVAALFYSGMYEYDAKFAYLELAEAQRFFATGDAVTGLELKVKDVDAARGVLARVQAALGGYPYRTKDWGELNRNLFSALQMEKLVMAVILGFIVLVASFIIVATLIMLVLEKTREIAVLKSMGAGVPGIMKIFVAEGLTIGAVGTFFGLVLGLGTCLLVDRVGIPLDPEVYYISNLPVLMDPGQFGLVALMSVALAFLATIYPATKAARLRPVDGLRSE